MTSALDDLYAALPDLACRSLCEASCHSRIDASDVEHQRLLDRGVDLPTTADGRPCPALTRTFGAGRCSVHQLRPMVCRVWGLAKAMPARTGADPTAASSMTPPCCVGCWTASRPAVATTSSPGPCGP